MRSAAQIIREMDNHVRRRDFRARQIEGAIGTLPWLSLAIFTGHLWPLAVVALLASTMTDEARRFRATGRHWQTRRSLWLGATTHDLVHRNLLAGWQP
jgi:hypothetical protein